MHQLQCGIHSNQTEGSPRHHSLKCLAAWASPHYGVAILCHHGPPEPLLGESQGLLLALMTGIAMHPIKHQAALTHRNDKCQHSICLAFMGHVYVHKTLVQGETVANMEEHLALFRLGLRSKALLKEGFLPGWQHALPEMEPLAAPSYGSICLLGLFPVYYVHRLQLRRLNSCFPAQMLMLLQELLIGFGLTPVSCPNDHSL